MVSGKMDTTILGRTGLEVSVAGLGCGGHSRLGMARGESEAHATGIVEHALSLGINFIDTARAYGTEVAVGKAIKGKRDQVVISTKSSAGRGGDLLSGGDVVESLDKSLGRLGTDYVDVFHLHGVTIDQYPHCVNEILPALRKQQEAGKVRFLGVTETFGRDPAHEMFQASLPDNHFDVIMVGFNMLNPSARKSVYPLTIANNVGTLTMFAVRRALSQPDALRSTVEGLIDEGKIAADAVDPAGPLGFIERHEDVTSVVQAAYRFCRHEPGAHVILTGTGSAAHLNENVESILAGPLPADLQDQLAAIFGDVDSVSGN